MAPSASRPAGPAASSPASPDASPDAGVRGTSVSSVSAIPLPPVDFDDGPAGRILAAAREILLRDGYSGLTMDGLTQVLGMSKKTLYVHFSSKDLMVEAIFAATGATLRRLVGEIVEGPGDFPQKLDRTLRVVGMHIAALRPEVLADLERFAPALLAHLNAIKERNIPLMLTRVLRIGVDQGMVRDDIDLDFIVEYWLIVAKGLHDSALLARVGLPPADVFDRALNLFLSGTLTPTGRRDVKR